MQFPPLHKATLLKRYKRFLADVVLESGETITCHCPNTGAMTGCAPAGATVWLSYHPNSKRKYAYSWELTELPCGALICINTQRANQVVYEALQQHLLTAIGPCDVIEKEYRIDKHRLDFSIIQKGQRGFIEVKSVTLLHEAQQGLFPDAKSQRATAHVQQLIQLKQQGFRAILLFCVQHSAIQSVRPASHIDPQYAETLQQAAQLGVEILACRTHISPKTLQVVAETIPVHLSE